MYTEFNAYDMIQMIALTSSKKSKVELLKVEPRLKPIVEAAYNPFKRYYLNDFPSEIISDNGLEIYSTETGELTEFTNIFLTGLSNRTLSGNEAKETLAQYMKSLTSGSAEILKMILNKDLRCGVSLKTIKQAYPGLLPETENAGESIPIMLLKTYKEEKIKFPCLVAFKLDGVRGRFINGHLYSRSKKRIIGLDHIETELSQLCKRIGIPEDFDGEITVPGDRFDSASGLIRNNNSVPEAVYNIFDIPFDNRRKKDRYRHLQRIIEELRMGERNITLISHYICNDETEIIMNYDEAISSGYEGIVIYNSDSLYEDKRSYDWMRMVPAYTADCAILAFQQGTGKYKNSLGAIIVEFGDTTVKVGTGFSDESRQDIWNNQGWFVNKIVEIEYKEKTKDGSMRQPRFKCFREDKNTHNID